MPALLDTSESVYGSYNWNDGAYAPFPLQVVVNKNGIITYISRQYNADAARAAIQQALDTE
ncbi:MAG: hypothetical protein H6739_01695 [Alphaproteobacteria bacterium]|nr:hypothetical protein [Alphaproteobacteria bacterium]